MSNIDMNFETLVEGSPEAVWAEYYHLPNHSKWSTGIESVEWEDMDVGSSLWTIGTLGQRISFRAVNHTVVEPKLIEWRTADSKLEVHGSVKFVQLGPRRTRINLHICIVTNMFIKVILGNPLSKAIVSRQLEGNLKRFAATIGQNERQNEQDYLVKASLMPPMEQSM